MSDDWKKELECPCIVIDYDQAVKNIHEMQKMADSCGVKLRPHIKTHKMPMFARLQIDAGAAGITCAKVSEAEVMAEGGIEDIFIAYPMVGKVRTERAIRLGRKVKRLILAVDSAEGAHMLDEAAERHGVRLEVRMEVDTGAGRTGVAEKHAAALAREITECRNLKLTGIYTFKSLVYQGKATADNEKAGKEEGEMMRRIADSIEAAGISLEDISAGSTPTGIEVAKTGCVTEIRPGTYIFKDVMLCKEHAAKPEEIAVRYYATVVSTPADGYAVIDGGTKTFPMDILLDCEPNFYPGYAVVEGNDDLQLRKMYEEHGIITSKKGKTGLKVGDVIALVPIHVCTAINMQNSVYVRRDGELEKIPVAARGMLL